MKLKLEKRIKLNCLILLACIVTLISCSSEIENKEKVQEKKEHISIKDTLHTEYFDVKVNSIDITPGIEIPSEEIQLMAGEGNMLVVIRATFTNKDTETRSAEEGVLFLNQNGKQYRYEKTEEIMAKGWGLFFDPINPLMSQTTNIVYKIPKSVKGEITWQPGRANDNEIIFLAKLDTLQKP